MSKEKLVSSLKNFSQSVSHRGELQTLWSVIRLFLVITELLYSTMVYCVGVEIQSHLFQRKGHIQGHAL